MSKRIATWVLAGALCTTVGWYAGASRADDPKPTAIPGMTDEQMKVWQALASPGPEHESLKAKVGKWKVELKTQMAPGVPEETSHGECVNTLTIGGRWLKQEATGTMVGMPYEDLGFMGYDNGRKKWVSVWFTSMCTASMTMYGDASDGGKTVTFADTVDDPMQPGTKFKMRIVCKDISADVSTMEMYEDRGQGEHKSVTMTYTRVK